MDLISFSLVYMNKPRKQEYLYFYVYVCADARCLCISALTVTGWPVLRWTTAAYVGDFAR